MTERQFRQLARSHALDGVVALGVLAQAKFDLHVAVVGVDGGAHDASHACLVRGVRVVLDQHGQVLELATVDLALQVLDGQLERRILDLVGAGRVRVDDALHQR